MHYPPIALSGLLKTLRVRDEGSRMIFKLQNTDPSMLNADEITTLQDQLTCEWHADPGASAKLSSSAEIDLSDQAKWMAIVLRQHRANYDLWHIEDEARRPGASDAELASVKRRIDATNQLRNDLVEELDSTLLAWLRRQNLQNPSAPLHSETPGLMIDRLSILSLKIFHTREECERAGAPAGHSERNRERLAILQEQRSDLAGCLDTLWNETRRGLLRFKLYRQMKMYNDPTLNPAIYGKVDRGK